MRKRTSILRSAGLLIVATIVLVLFIAITGDSRRQTNAMHRARAYAAELATRIGEGKLLPLNLSPGGLAAGERQPIGMEWVASSDAYWLRRTGRTVVAAWSVPVVRALGADGRAVIFFEGGAFVVRWLTLREFGQSMAAQNAVLEKLRTQAPNP